jgi:hypothetical protein
MSVIFMRGKQRRRNIKLNGNRTNGSYQEKLIS